MNYNDLAAIVAWRKSASCVSAMRLAEHIKQSEARHKPEEGPTWHVASNDLLAQVRFFKKNGTQMYCFRFLSTITGDFITLSQRHFTQLIKVYTNDLHQILSFFDS
jgi:hypothetical protein